MAKLTLDGHEYEIAPYKLGSLRKAAPTIDRINAENKAAGGHERTMTQMAGSMADLVEVLSIGLVKIDPALTPEAVEEMVDFGDLPALLECFTGVMAESGLALGEAAAPAPDRAPAGA